MLEPKKSSGKKIKDTKMEKDKFMMEKQKNGQYDSPVAAEPNGKFWAAQVRWNGRWMAKVENENGEVAWLKKDSISSTFDIPENLRKVGIVLNFGSKGPKDKFANEVYYVVARVDEAAGRIYGTWFSDFGSDAEAEKYSRKVLEAKPVEQKPVEKPVEKPIKKGRITKETCSRAREIREAAAKKFGCSVREISWSLCMGMAMRGEK